MSKIVVTDYVEENLDWELQQFNQAGIEFEIHQGIFASPEELISYCRQADVVVVNMAKMNKQVIDGLEQCRLLIRHGIGYDNVDVDAAAQKDIPVVNIPDYCVPEVAEQTLALLLSAGRRMPEQMEAFRISTAKETWDFSPIPRVRRISGKTVGIIGFGRIGSAVHRMLEGFDVRRLVSDPYITEERKKECGVVHTALDKLAEESDFICVNAALNGETLHLLDADLFSKMKPECIVVNTARGGLIDQAALAAALKEGRIAGAALDVFEHGEPPPLDNPLISCPNIIMTPHYSWASEESAWIIRKDIVRIIIDFFNGTDPEHIVNKRK